MNLAMLWATLRLMSRIPVPEKWADGVEFRQLARGVPWFVLIGAIIGGLAGLVAVVVNQTGGGIYIAAAAYVLALVLLTGGFHLDGLADTCDGIFSARTRERMLEIMKDSRLGTFGGLALVFSILIKVCAVFTLAQLPLKEWFSLLVCAPIAGRAVLVLGMYGQRYAREGEGMGSLYIGQVGLRKTALTLLAGAIAVGLIAGIHGLAAILVTYVVSYALVHSIRRRLGGQTGDTLGALAETAEMVFLLALLWV